MNLCDFVSIPSIFVANGVTLTAIVTGNNEAVTLKPLIKTITTQSITFSCRIVCGTEAMSCQNKKRVIHAGIFC